MRIVGTAECHVFANAQCSNSPKNEFIDVPIMILETAVGCARGCCVRRVQQGMTTLRALARKEDQRGWARWAWCHWVRSGVTQAVSGQKEEKVRMHAVCEMFTSGQLLFLG